MSDCYHGPDFLLAALDALAHLPNSFVALVLIDLTWLYDGRGKQYGMPDPRESVPATIAWVASCPKRWRKLLYRSKAAVTSHSSLVAFGEWWQHQRITECDRREFPDAANVQVVTPADSQDNQWYKCWCGYVCSSFAKLSLHAANKHGYRQPEYYYLSDDGLCGGCLKLFHNKRRLLRHLADSKDKVCLHRLSTNLAPTFFGTERSEYGKAAQSDAAHRNGAPRDQDRRPVQQCEGPMLPVGEVEIPEGPTGLAFTFCDAPAATPKCKPVEMSYQVLVEGTLAALFVTCDVFLC